MEYKEQNNTLNPEKEHSLGRLDIEYDKNLINSILNDINTKYTILYLYIIRKDLFKNLDKDLLDKYEKVIVLDDIYKNNVELSWDEDFIDKVIELGLFKNIRSRNEYNQKDGNFILKMGEYTVTIEKNIIITPIDTLFHMISKKFKSVSQRGFELGLTKLKEVRCESSSVVHHLIYEIGYNEYVLSDDLYKILDKFGNVYQAIRIEPTSDGLFQLCNEIQDKIVNIVKIFDPIINNEIIIKKLTKALEINNKEEKLKIIEISIRLKLLEKSIILTLSNSDFEILSNYKDEMETLNKQLRKIKSYYSGNQDYLEFLEKIPIKIDKIQETLIKIRENARGAKKAVLDLEKRMKLKTSDDIHNIPKKLEVIYQNIKIEPTIDELLQICKELKDKTASFIRIFNPILDNKPIIKKIIKTLEKNEEIIINKKKEKLELAEISIKLKLSEKNIKLNLSNSDFQILSNSKDELEIYYKQLVEMESNSSEIENYQESLNEIKENIIGARKLVMDIEGRMLLITK